ncbi:MAG: ATP-binding protein [Anaerolineae bacterium]
MQGILIAASEPATRHTLQAMCEQHHFRTAEVSTTQECIQLVQEQLFDLVILSFELNGTLPDSVCARLRFFTDTPVLLLTPYTEVELALEAGATDVVEWPSHPLLVTHRIRAIMQSAVIKDAPRSDSAIIGQRLANALRDTAAILNSSLEFETVLDQILVSIQQVIPNDMSTIFLIDSASYEGYGVRTLDNTGRELGNILNQFKLPIKGIQHLEDMIESGNSLLIPDTQTFTSWFTEPTTSWVRAVVSAPIQVDNEIIGFIFLNSQTPHSFTNADSEILRIFANQAGAAIRNARLYETTQDYARKLESRVMERTAELVRERAQLRAILDSMSDGVLGVIYDEDMETPVYSFINPALYNLLGYDLDELNTLVDISLIGIDPTQYSSFYSRLRDSVKESGLWKGEVNIRHKDGRPVDTELTITRLNRADGSMMGMVTVFRDMRQQKDLDNQRKRFVASAAHELRNPIAALKARIYLMSKQPEKSDTHVEVMERINDHLENLVEELLDLSRFEHGLIHLKRQPTEMTSFIQESLLLLGIDAHEKKVELITRLTQSPVPVYIDRTRMLQVLSNLVTNAIKFTPEDGAVVLSLNKEIDKSTGDGFLLLTIEDTGPGIESEHVDHIFEPFYRVRDGGRGLGWGWPLSKKSLNYMVVKLV